MADRPILFSAPMVRALLAGTKTQTRRVVKPQPQPDSRGVMMWQISKHRAIGFQGKDVHPDIPEHCPYGQPGDRLWVRETYRLDVQFDSLAPRDVPVDSPYFMEASRSRWEGGPHDGIPGKLRPAIHMPRWVSRITLEVTGVRVERLQDISEADSIAEGLHFHDGRGIGHSGWREGHGVGFVYDTAREAYADLWQSINGPGTWAANPWVWVVKFKRVTP